MEERLRLVNKQTVERVSALQRSNPMAAKEGGVELKREPSSGGCSYKGCRLRKKLLQLKENNECWKAESITISRIYYFDNDTRYIPVFKHTDWSIVQAKWNELISQVQTYPHAQQPRNINNYPQSIYCDFSFFNFKVDVDFVVDIIFGVDVDGYYDVNNSNTHSLAVRQNLV